MEKTEITTKDFKLFPFATNPNGIKIFCRLAFKKKTIVKGYYDFNEEYFFITKFFYNNFPKEIIKKEIINILKNILEIDYDWELYQ